MTTNLIIILEKKNHPHSSLFTLQRKEFLQKQGITHILSAYRPSVEPKIPFLQPTTENNDDNNDDDDNDKDDDDDDDKGEEVSKTPKFKRMLVEIEDSSSENIIKHFPKSNAFIQDGLNAGGGVLVHW